MFSFTLAALPFCPAFAGFAGRQIGRRRSTKADIPAVFWKHYPAFMESKLNVSEFARMCGVSRPTVYKYLRIGK